jgi:hypothetical protein
LTGPARAQIGPGQPLTVDQSALTEAHLLATIDYEATTCQPKI